MLDEMYSVKLGSHTASYERNRFTPFNKDLYKSYEGIGATVEFDGEEFFVMNNVGYKKTNCSKLENYFDFAFISAIHGTIYKIGASCVLKPHNEKDVLNAIFDKIQEISNVEAELIQGPMNKKFLMWDSEDGNIVLERDLFSARMYLTWPNIANMNIKKRSIASRIKKLFE